MFSASETTSTEPTESRERSAMAKLEKSETSAAQDIGCWWVTFPSLSSLFSQFDGGWRKLVCGCSSWNLLGKWGWNTGQLQRRHEK